MARTKQQSKDDQSCERDPAREARREADAQAFLEGRVENGGYDAAHRLTGISVETLYVLVNQRRIPHIRIGPRFVLFNRAELLRWLESHRVQVAS